MNINNYSLTFILLFLLTTSGYSQIAPSDIERSTYLLTGTVTNKEGKSKSFNISFASSPALKYVENGGAQALSKSYNSLEKYNLNFTGSNSTVDNVLKRRVSKSGSKDIINTHFNKTLPDQLKLKITTSGRVVLKGNATAKIDLKLQVGNRTLGFKQENVRYVFRLAEGDPGNINVFDKHNVPVSTIPNGGYFWFTYQDSSYKTIIGVKEAVFTTNTITEARPLPTTESYSYLSTDSEFDLIK